MTPEGKKLLLRVKRKILDEPAQFVMERFFFKPSPHERWWNGDLVRKKIPNCGTAACIGGWAIALADHEKPSVLRLRYDADSSVDIHVEGRRVLGVDEVEANNLFLRHMWPVQFRFRWLEAKTMKGRARIAADRIDHFIKTGE